MQQNFVLTLRKVIEQARLREAVGLQVMPDLVTQVALVKVDMEDADDGAGLVLLVGNFFVDLADLEVIKDAIGQHVTDQCGVSNVDSFFAMLQR